MIRLAPNLEIEVAPKFLGTSWDGWRADFFVIAQVSRFGKLLPRERLAAGFGERGDLATLVGRALVDMYWQHYRRPLRVYRRHDERSFAVDGDVDPEELLIPDPDGYLQSVVTLDRQNQYNQVIQAAVEELQGEVRDFEVRRQLSHVRGLLAPRRRCVTRLEPGASRTDIGSGKCCTT